MDQSALLEDPREGAPAEMTAVFTGRVGEIYRMFIVNLLLTIITLGIYRFWAKVRYRKYLWSHVSLAGDPFEYTGTGRELLFGFLIILFAVILPLVVVNQVAQVMLGTRHLLLLGSFQLAFYVLIVFLIGLGTYAAIRYRLSRTLWRGIRGGLTGSRSAYGLRVLGYGVLAFITFGFCLPLMQVRLSQYLYNHMSFGSGKFAFEASVRPLFRRVVWVPILGLLMVASLVAAFATWPSAKASSMGVVAASAAALLMILMIVAYVRYTAASLRYIYSRVTFEGLQLRYDISAWRLFRYAAGNLVILVFTLGLGFPVVLVRMVRIVTDNLTIIGTIDFAVIRQSTDQRSRFGEGLASAFDIGAI
jgi:uncharacterized membrane protein YjgN (DUF898 family)